MTPADDLPTVIHRTPEQLSAQRARLIASTGMTEDVLRERGGAFQLYIGRDGDLWEVEETGRLLLVRSKFGSSCVGITRESREYVEEIAGPLLPVDLDADRPARHEQLQALLSRMDRGVLSDAEEALLRIMVEAEMAKAERLEQERDRLACYLVDGWLGQR